MLRAYPANKVDNRPHGLLYAIPYPVNCATPADMIGVVAVWKNKSKKQQVMTWCDLKGTELDSGLTWLLREFWAAKGHVYTHPTLDAESGLVEPTGYACRSDPEPLYEVEKVLSHNPSFAASADDSNLRGYVVKWLSFSESSFVSVAGMTGCAEAISDYWSTEPHVSRETTICIWAPHPFAEIYLYLSFFD